MNPLALLAAMWEALMDIAPIARWVQAIENFLKFLALLAILLVLLMLFLIINDWGFSQTARVVLIVAFLLMLVAILVIGVILARSPADPLFNPLERSLSAGRRYGTEAKPRSRLEAGALEKKASDPQLEPPPEPPADVKKLIEGE